MAKDQRRILAKQNYREQAPDLKVDEEIEEVGVRCAVVWECALRGKARRGDEYLLEAEVG